MAPSRARPLALVLLALVCGVTIPLYFLARRLSRDGGYTEWSDWSQCSKECGEGIQVRRKTCTNPAPGSFGKSCVELQLGNAVEEGKCIVKECPIDGGFTEWSAYGGCSKTCGDDGSQKRTRSCSNPPPQFGGKDCQGHVEETQDCNRRRCPIDGGFSDWTAFSNCEKTCGAAVKKRTRTCSNPPPSYGGKNCDGPVDELQDCNLPPCVIDGGFTDWSAFGECDKSCGGGHQSRKRTCTNPPPANGGKDCIGITEDVRNCNNFPCQGVQQ